MFTWLEVVQSYALYSDMLDRFVSGEVTDQLFIDAVSDIIDNGRKKEERYSNFQTALEVLGVKEF